MTNFWNELKKGFTVLAPMEDVTDVVFRQIIVDCGKPDVLFTEFTSTDGLISKGREKVIRRLKFKKNEHPIVAQIWGNNPDKYYESAKLIEEMGFDGIDINMGCPVRKVVKRGECSGLIDNKPLAKELVLAAMEGVTNIPVSVKTRMGNRKIETEEWSEFLLELNPAALTMHGRLAKDMSKLPANWEEIAKVVKIRDRIYSSDKQPPIIGNGDVMSLEEVDEKVQKYGVEGVMIGRGIFNDPFVFNPEKSLSDLSLKERLELLIKHTELFLETWGDQRNFGIMKKFYKIYISEFEGASELRNELMQTNSIKDVEKIVEKIV